jgi:hypothetical protein
LLSDCEKRRITAPNYQSWKSIANPLRMIWRPSLPPNLCGRMRRGRMSRLGTRCNAADPRRVDEGGWQKDGRADFMMLLINEHFHDIIARRMFDGCQSRSAHRL